VLRCPWGEEGRRWCGWCLLPSGFATLTSSAWKSLSSSSSSSFKRECSWCSFAGSYLPGAKLGRQY